MKEIIPQVTIESRIHIIRGKKVMLDRDLATLYGVETRTLNQAVQRNLNRFPADFMFQLSKVELGNLKSQIVISNWGGIRKSPYAFTENGVAMLSSVLNSERAIKVNIQIMRVFTRIRNLLTGDTTLKKLIETHEKRLDIHDSLIQQAFDIVKKVLDPDPLPVKTEYAPDEKKWASGRVRNNCRYLRAEMRKCILKTTEYKELLQRIDDKLK
jgi:ORF6N domain